mgnify:CR=1 FL=1
MIILWYWYINPLLIKGGFLYIVDMKKIIISQSIMWAAAILVVAILDDTNFEILLLVVLATISILNLNKAK